MEAPSCLPHLMSRSTQTAERADTIADCGHEAEAPADQTGDGHLHGRVVVAHRWRADSMTDTNADEAAFFEGFDGEFDREEVAAELLPEGYKMRLRVDTKLPVLVFVMRRKH